MSTYKVTVSEDKEKFFIELMNNLGLRIVNLSSTEGKSSLKQKEIPTPPPASYELDEEARKKAAKVREDSLKDVISRIEQLRKGQ